MSTTTSGLPPSPRNNVTEDDVLKARIRASQTFQRILEEMEREEAKNQRGIRKYLHRLGLV